MMAPDATATINHLTDMLNTNNAITQWVNALETTRAIELPNRDLGDQSERADPRQGQKGDPMAEKQERQPGHGKEEKANPLHQSGVARHPQLFFHGSREPQSCGRVAFRLPSVRPP